MVPPPGAEQREVLTIETNRDLNLFAVEDLFDLI